MDKTDIIQLHAGTGLKKNILSHEAMGIRIELNCAGLCIANKIMGDGATLDEITTELASRFANPAAQLASDTSLFISRLDDRDLVRIIRSRPPGLFPKAIDLMVNLTTFRWTEEIRRGTRCYPPSFLNALRATYRSQRLLLLLLMGSGLIMGALVQLLANDSPSKSGAVALAAFLPIWLATVHFTLLAVHELGHIHALCGQKQKRSKRCVLMQRGFMVYIIHKRYQARRELAVAVAGPLAAFLIGCVLSLASLAFPLDSKVIPSGFVFMPAVLGAIHLLSFLPLSGDGSAVLSAWRQMRRGE